MMKLSRTDKMSARRIAGIGSPLDLIAAHIRRAAASACSIVLNPRSRNHDATERGLAITSNKPMPPRAECALTINQAAPIPAMRRALILFRCATASSWICRPKLLLIAEQRSARC